MVFLEKLNDRIEGENAYQRKYERVKNELVIYVGLSQGNLAALEVLPFNIYLIWGENVVNLVLRQA